MTVRPDGWTWAILPIRIRKAAWNRDKQIEWHNSYGLIAALPGLMFFSVFLVPWLGETVVFFIVCPLLLMHGLGYQPLLVWTARERVSIGSCGGCKYLLTSLQNETDGCTLCPECGAAWKLDHSHGTR